jgi:heat shock protein HtpX
MSEPVLFHDLQQRARRRSAVFLGGTFVLLWLVVNVFAVPGHVDEEGAWRFAPLVWLATAAIAAGYLAVAHFASGRAALSLSGAHPATGPEYQQLRNVVEEMAIAAGTPVPKVYVIDDPSPNAFATGRSPEHAAVTVTTGLLRSMSRRELKGVVAHEIGHIANRDISITTIAVLTAGTIAVLADVMMRFGWVIMASTRRARGRDAGAQAGIGAAVLAIAFLLYVVALPAALLLRAALSRQRETLADASAVQYTRDPTGIRSALEKLEADPTIPQRVSTATAHLWIEEPKPVGRPQRRILSGLFDTHPPIAERIGILRRMEGIDPNGRGPNDRPPDAGPAGAWPPPHTPEQ